jgi:ribonuclease HI
MPDAQTQLSLGSGRPKVILYTDGGCEPNPGKGGYGVVLLQDGQRRELSEGYQRTTNNRMEILAAIKGLEALEQPSEVLLHSDSQYLINAITKGWARKWRAKGWYRTDKEKAKNPDLWKRMLLLCERHLVSFKWVKGHAGDVENERCDELATLAMQGELIEDPGYVPAEPAQTKGPQGQLSLAPQGVLVEGAACKVCAGPLERRTPKRKPPKPGGYYYEYYHRFRSCERMFMPDEAKRYWK